MRKKHEEVWYNCLLIIKDNIPDNSFNTWFKPIIPIKLEQNVLTIEVPSTFFYEFIEERYIDLLKKVLYKELGSEAKLEYSIKIDNSSTSNGSKNPNIILPTGNVTDLSNKPVALISEVKNPFGPYVTPGIKKVHVNPNLNSINSFDNFVVGKCNKLAASAGKAIGAQPGSTAYNPIYIWGDSGMGKTHLAQAIGIEVKNNFKDDKIVLYVPANKFQTQYSDAARKNMRNDFLHFYQMVDVLIIDDVQEFAGKPGTQDSFFHIFNHLHQSGKQLILTADRPPSELNGVSARLISRFKWALTTELVAPDFETRIAIINKKTKNDGIVLDRQIVNYLAENVSGSIRDLEGTIISLMAHSTLNKEEITLDFARKQIDHLDKRPTNDMTIDFIKKIVCDFLGVKVDDMQTKSRKQEIVQARQISMFFAKKYTKASLSTIGAEIGNKDHATVLYAHKTVNNLFDTDKVYKTNIMGIEQRIIALF
jgi:chromosomal replication initiator protein